MMTEFGTAVLLAGGLSSRMGFDKQFLEIGTRVLSNYLVGVLKEEFREIIIVTNKPECYSCRSLTVVSDEIRGKGPLGGIHAGLKSASSRFVYFLACDMPNINLEYIRFMKSRILGSDFDACVTESGDWIEPFNAFYAQSCIPAIESYLQTGRKAVFPLAKTLNSLFVKESAAREFSPDWSMFINLNTRQEVEAYIATLQNPERNGSRALTYGCRDCEKPSTLAIGV
jgi:molybdenum cofactor guanylyltransferase